MKFLFISIFFLSCSQVFCEGILVNKTCETYNITVELVKESLKLPKFLNKTWYEISQFGGKEENCTRDVITQIGNITTVTRYTSDNKNKSTYTIHENNITNYVTVDNLTLAIRILEYKEYIVAWDCSNVTNISSRQTLTVLSQDKFKTINKTDTVHQVFINGTNITLSRIYHSPDICEKSSGTTNPVYIIVSLIAIFLLTQSV